MRKILSPPILVVISIGLMGLLNYFIRKPVFAREPWTVAAAIPAVLGIVIAYSAWRRMRREGTTVKCFNEPARLVTSGVFRYTRNPIYVGYVLGLIGAWIAYGAVSAGLVVVVFVLVVDRFYIRWEEKTLARKFGQDYEAYRAQTRRWI
ncbi:MAG: isoprenylcysteine carboxylmethyltransferase family protein [Phycisphaerae bacterium]